MSVLSGVNLETKQTGTKQTVCNNEVSVLAGVTVIQSTPDNSNLQGKSKKGSSYRQFEENSRE